MATRLSESRGRKHFTRESDCARCSIREEAIHEGPHRAMAYLRKESMVSCDAML